MAADSTPWYVGGGGGGGGARACIVADGETRDGTTVVKRENRAAKRPSSNARVGQRNAVVKRRSDGNRTSRSEIDRIGPQRTY